MKKQPTKLTLVILGFLLGMAVDVIYVNFRLGMTLKDAIAILEIHNDKNTKEVEKPE